MIKGPGHGLQSLRDGGLHWSLLGLSLGRSGKDSNDNSFAFSVRMKKLISSFQAYQNVGFEKATYFPISVIATSTIAFLMIFARERIRGEAKSNSG